MHKKCKLIGLKFGIIAFVSRFTFRDIYGRGLLKQHEERALPRPVYVKSYKEGGYEDARYQVD